MSFIITPLKCSSTCLKWSRAKTANSTFSPLVRPAPFGTNGATFEQRNVITQTIYIRQFLEHQTGHPNYFIYPEIAFDRISLHNAYFPQCSMEVMGYGRDSLGQFQIIVQQPFIQGTKMTDAEIKLYVEKLGYRLVNQSNWTYATERIYLSDMHDENVIRSLRGNVFVIDCDIRINTPDLKAGGEQCLSHHVSFLEV